MTLPRTWDFPLLALATSPRGSAFVAMATPFHVEARASSRKPWPGDAGRVLAWLEPRTILVTHAARWNPVREVGEAARLLNPPEPARIETVGLDQVCNVLACERTTAGIADRLIDMYPETERLFATFLTDRCRTDRVRNGHPLLSAFAVAHAAAVAHLIKFG